MRTLITLLLLSAHHVALSQDYEFPDFRSKRDNFSKMREKEIRSDLSVFTMAGIDESIGKQPLHTIPVNKYGDNFMEFEGNNIRVIIKAGPFDKIKHKLTYSEENLVKIDGKPYYGNYGKLPARGIESVTIIADKDTIQVPSPAVADLYNPSFIYRDGTGTVKSHNGVHLSAGNRNIYIYMLNREASGSYEVTWVIQDKKYLRRVVDFGLLK